MGQIKIDHIDRDGQTVVLLDERNRLRALAFIEDRKAEADRLKKLGMKEASVQALLEADAAQRDLDADAALRQQYAGQVKTAIIEFREPTLEDQDAVKAAMKAEGADLSTGHRAAFDRLADVTLPVPLRFQTLAAEACYASIFFDLSEDRRSFLIRSRSGSS